MTLLFILGVLLLVVLIVHFMDKAAQQRRKDEAIYQMYKGASQVEQSTYGEMDRVSNEYKSSVRDISGR